MKLMNCSVDKFVDECKAGNKIYCFGAGAIADTFLELLFYYGLDTFIEAFVDNDSKKWNSCKKTVKNSFPIISLQEMLNSITSNDIIIITCSDIQGIYEQLSKIKLMEDNKCFIAYVIWSNQYGHSKFNDKFRLCTEQKIPKVIHYCWFGRKDIPRQYREWMESWQKLCPDYQIKEWNEDNYDITKNKYMLQAYESEKWGFVSDYARLDIIYKYGGIYLDTDVELIHNLDDLLYQDGFCGFDLTLTVNTGSGFGGIKENELFGEMRDYYNSIEFINEENRLDLRTCNVHQNRILEKYNLRLDGSYQNIKGVSVYPTTVLLGEDIYTLEKQIGPNTLAIHHASGSWLSVEMQNWRRNRINFMRQISKKNSF